MAANRDRFSPAITSIENRVEVTKFMRKSFKKKELRALRYNDLVFRFNIFANPQKEIVHFAISYISDDPEMDRRMIQFQEEMREIITLEFPGVGLRALKIDGKLTEEQAAALYGARSGNLNFEAASRSGEVRVVRPEDGEGYGYYYNGWMVRYDNI